MAPEHSGFIDVPGGRIWYRVDGSRHDSLPPVLVLHGGPGMTHDYLLPCRALADERTVVMYDQLDTGRSTRTNDTANWTLERFTDEIDCLRTALKLDRVHLLGSSWGATLAVNYARRQPTGLQSMLLSGPMLDAQRWVRDNEVYRQSLPAETLATLRRYEATGDYAAAAYQQAVLQFYHRHLCRMEVWPEEVQRTFETGNNDQLQFMWGPTEFLATGPLKHLDLTIALPVITTPTLYVVGEFDEAPPATAAEFAARMPRASTLVVPGASHMPHLEAPARFFPAARAFFSRHDVLDQR